MTARADDRLLGPIGTVLELVEVGEGRFRTRNPSLLATADARGADESRDDDRRRVFGGQLLGQSLRAALATVPAGRAVHSLHAYFVRGADGSRPLELAVESARDGRGVSNRRVICSQGEREVLMLQASFQVPASGTSRYDPPSGWLGRHSEYEDAVGEAAHTWSGVSLRFGPAEFSSDPTDGHQVRRRVWLKVDEDLGPDPVLHACALAYASDLTLLRTALEAEPGPAPEEDPGPIRLASLDHALWFHRPVRLDHWLLLESVAPSTHGSRALTMGHLYDQDGEMVATIAQEGVLRHPAG